MDKYINASKLKAKVISGEPVLFDEATQHEIFFLLELEPSEDVKPVVHAHWEAKYNPEELSADTPCKCSNCGAEEPICFISDWDFCPHCGARMDEEEGK